MMMRLSWPLVVSVALLAAMVGYLVVSAWMGQQASAAAATRRHPMPPPFVIYRALAPPDVYGRVALASLSPEPEARTSMLQCARLHYAGGGGLCAAQESARGAVRNVVYVFDPMLRRTRRVALDGIPTRLRVSPSGRIGAITSYSEEETDAGERLVTRTRIVDMRRGEVTADLGEFHVDNLHLPPIRGHVDVAGVAFERGDDRFFATLATETERYLVAGSLRERRLTAIRTGVASEGLSPDGRRLAVKRLLPERGRWQLAVIDLSTWQEHDLLQGPRSVDDQVDWLDDEHVMYHDADGEGTALWMLPVDGNNGPRVLLKDAYSGAVQR